MRRSAKQMCGTRVGCPVGTKELKFGLFDSYGDGWGYGPTGTASPGHQITVKHLDVVLPGFPRTLTGGSDTWDGVEYTCVPEVSTNDFGCISVSVDSSTDCATRVGGGNCWSSEVGWSLHTIDRQSGVETLVVQEYTAPGIAGGDWTNGHANCPSAAAPVTVGGSGVASTQGHCSIGEVMCANQVECIPSAYLCDGDLTFGNAQWGPDCADSSDEVWEWCADPARDDDDRLSHNRFRPVGPTGGVNLARVCSLGEPSFMCTMSDGRVEGCAVDGCSACYFCDDTTPGCLLEPAACLASGCFWDTSDTECRMSLAADPALPAGCQDLQLDPSCSDDSEYCPVACYDSLQLITPTCLTAFETLGVSTDWSAQVQALKAVGGRCNVGGCSGATRTELRFLMRDSWGDGWNEPGTTGNEWEIKSTSVTDVETSEMGTLLEGAEAEKNLCIDSTATKCVLVHVTGDGTYPEEIAWTVKSAATGATLTPRATMSAHSYYLFDATPADGVDDCGTVATPAKLFRCRGGVMINWNLLCDGNFDCRDQDDEASGGLAGFCPHAASCDVLTPSRVGNGFCDAGTDYDTMSCGYDGGDCTCEHNYEAIKTDCSFTGDTPPTGRCLDFGTCAAGRTSTTNGVTTTIPTFASFMRDCRDELFYQDARLPALEDFALTCAATFTCTSGERTMLSNKCDGVKHCVDGSDEGFQMCGSEYVFGNTGRAFRCINGNEVEAALECNGVCNCWNRQTGMCEDEHPVRGDTTCAAQECARRATSILATCGGTWPASMLATGEQKARCGVMCAPLLVELLADAACTSHRPTGLTAAKAADASRVCQFVLTNHVQPSFLCRDSAGLTVPL
jgi:hypothetical protein